MIFQSRSQDPIFHLEGEGDGTLGTHTKLGGWGWGATYIFAAPPQS